MSQLRVGVIGVGYLGQFHAQKYAQMPDVDLVGVVDVIAERAEAIARQNQTAAYAAYADLFDRVDAVSVVVPTPIHFQVSRDFLEKGVDVLIEKPITTTTQDADALLALAARKGRVIQVGHLEQFNPAVRALHDVVSNPFLIESRRLSVFKNRCIDVSVVHDLMIHDIDIVLRFVPSPLKSIHAAGSAVITEHIDIANARLGFENGCVANITASRIAAADERKITFFQSDACIAADFVTHQMTVMRPGGNPVLGMETETRNLEKGDALKAELSAFVKAVRGRKTPHVTGQMGRDALEIAVNITAQIRNGYGGPTR